MNCYLSHYISPIDALSLLLNCCLEVHSCKFQLRNLENITCSLSLHKFSFGHKESLPTRDDRQSQCVLYLKVYWLTCGFCHDGFSLPPIAVYTCIPFYHTKLWLYIASAK